MRPAEAPHHQVLAEGFGPSLGLEADGGSRDPDSRAEEDDPADRQQRLLLAERADPRRDAGEEERRGESTTARTYSSARCFAAPAASECTPAAASSRSLSSAAATRYCGIANGDSGAFGVASAVSSRARRRRQAGTASAETLASRSCASSVARSTYGVEPLGEVAMALDLPQLRRPRDACARAASIRMARSSGPDDLSVLDARPARGLVAAPGDTDGGEREDDGRAGRPAIASRGLPSSPSTRRRSRPGRSRARPPSARSATAAPSGASPSG